MKYFLTLPFLTLLFVGCNYSPHETSLTTKTFTHVDTVIGNAIINNQILNPRELIIIDDYLVVSNQKKDSIFYVFDLSDFSIVKIFGKKGRGPKEYVFPNLCMSDSKESNFFIKDIGKRKINSINVNHLISGGENHIGDAFNWKSSKIPLNMTVVEGNVIFDSFTPNNGAIYISDLYKNNEKIIHDFGDFSDKYKNSSVYKGYLIAGKDKIIYAYQYFKRFDIFDIHGNLLSSVSFDKDGPKFNTQGLIDRKESTVYYIGAFAGKEYFYLLAFDGNGKYFEKNINNVVSFVEVYDWEGNPVKKIVLNKYISFFTIDEERSLLIGIDPRSEQPLFKFEIASQVRD